MVGGDLNRARVLRLVLYGLAALAALAVLPQVSANHIRGEFLEWHQTGAPTNVEFTGEVSARYSYWLPGYIPTVGTMTPAYGFLNFGDGSPGVSVRERVTSVNPGQDMYHATIVASTTGLPVQHTYLAPPSGLGYNAVIDGCCWHTASATWAGVTSYHINNFGTKFRLDTTVWPGPGAASPAPAPWIPDYVCIVGVPCSISFKATSPMGLPLTYRFSTVPETSASWWNPLPGATIDPFSGVVTWTPPPLLHPGATSREYYSVAVAVDQPIGNGVLPIPRLPMQSFVQVCDPMDPAPNLPPALCKGMITSPPGWGASAGTTPNGVIVSHGANPTTSASTKTMIWNGAWAPLADAFIPRSQAAGVAGQPNVPFAYWAIGGIGPYCIGPGGTCDWVEHYDPITDKWSIQQPMPTPRAGIAAALSAHHIVVFGGRQCGAPACGAPLATVEIFEPSMPGTLGLGTWFTGPNLATAREDATVATASLWGQPCEPIYVAGGNTGPGTPDLTSVEVYDDCSGSFVTPLPPMLHGVSNAIATWCNNRLYVVGGTTGGVATDWVQMWDGSSWVAGHWGSPLNNLAISQVGRTPFAPGVIYAATFPGAPVTTIPC